MRDPLRETEQSKGVPSRQEAARTASAALYPGMKVMSGPPSQPAPAWAFYLATVERQRRVTTTPAQAPSDAPAGIP